jgi:hypothetical protein
MLPPSKTSFERFTALFQLLPAESSIKIVCGLSDLMFSPELQNLLTMVDSPIASICAHSGYSITNIKNSTPLYIRFLDALPQASRMLSTR